jgi:hypothetical protein
MTVLTELPPANAFTEVPGMRGLRIARVGQADGKTLEVIEAVKGVVIPVVKNPGAERGRLLDGKLQLTLGGRTEILEAGATWEVGALQEQGPHVFLEPSRVVILRSGKSAYDD